MADSKLNPHDEGETMIMVREEKGCVVIEFPDPTKWVGLPPQQACDLAAIIIKRAREVARHTGQMITVRI